MSSDAVTLQVSLAPSDLLHAVRILPHQVTTWAGQVDEVLLSVDLHRANRRGRFAAGWEVHRPKMDDLLAEVCSAHAKARVAEVDYSPSTMESVAEAFFGGTFIPTNDTRGGPFYSYFHGLHAARHDRILHMDSDMLFGGGSQSWVAEALQVLSDRPDTLACSPLPGPPRADGTIDQSAERLQMSTPAFRFQTLSTRLFLLDRGRLFAQAGGLRLGHRLRLRSRAKARLQGNPPYASPELLLSAAMRRAGLQRVDFLGRQPGMWSLHPAYRSDAFYRRLPALIERVERGEVPDEQRGHYDIHDSLHDFSAARRQFALRRLWQ